MRGLSAGHLLAPVTRFIARQSRQPSGPTAAIYGRILDRDHRTINREAVRRLGLEPGSRALDVGFGGGVGLRNLLSGPARLVAGIDPSAEMVAGARRRFRADIEAGRLMVARASVDAIPFADASFDRALSVHTIYFWPDVDKGLRELARVLAPGGSLLLATATRDFMARLPYTRHGFNLFDDDQLACALHEAGFLDVQVTRSGQRVFSSGRTAG